MSMDAGEFLSQMDAAVAAFLSQNHRRLAWEARHFYQRTQEIEAEKRQGRRGSGRADARARVDDAGRPTPVGEPDADQ